MLGVVTRSPPPTLNLLATLAVAAGGLLSSAAAVGATTSSAPQPVAAPLPIAVIGDSDSQGYQNRVWFPEGGRERGGKLRATTLQWTEVLARLRPDAVDLGPHAVFGWPRRLLRALDTVGFYGGRPRTEDHLHNFAMSGASCLSFTSHAYRQAIRMVRLLDSDPGKWDRGIVVMRAGANDFGGTEQLDRLAANPADPALRSRIDACLDEYRAAISLVRARHPRTRMVIVGTSNNAHWEPNHGRWQSQADLSHIDQGLDRFDNGLRAMEAQDPNIVFFDDRAWFRRLWGDRDGSGRPAYRSIVLAGLEVTNTTGDDPMHAVLADGHAGLVWNTLWAQALVATINTRFGPVLPPITEDEVTRFLQSMPTWPASATGASSR